MQLESALLIGVLFGCGVWLLLQPGFVRVIFGFIVLSNTANLFLLVSSGDPSGRNAPVIGAEPGLMVDPLPQALILTAIVIGFSVTAYLLVLFYRIFLDHKTTDARTLFDRPRADVPPSATEEAS